MSAYFYLILGIAAAFGTAFAVSTRGILYHTPDTDNELMVYAAAQSDKWRWPSDLHKYGIGKTGMKDLTIILLSFFQKIFRDKTSDYPYTVLGGLVNAYSAVLIYLIGSNYWGSPIGLFLALLFLISLWNWQIALYGGHINVATMFFLLSILFIQQVGLSVSMPFIWLFAGGAMFCFAQFSSASSIKYTPLFLGALFYAEHWQLINQERWFSIFSASASIYVKFLNSALPLLTILTYLTIRLTYKKIVSKMYYQKAPHFLNKIIEGRESFPLDYYLRHAHKQINFLIGWSAWTILLFLIMINAVQLSYLTLVFIGFFAAFLILTLPNVKRSVKYYFNFLLETQVRKKSHFRLYVDYFSQKGITVSRYTQGAGLRWIPKILFRMIPIHTSIFIAAIIVSLINLVESPSNLFIFLALLFFSTSPIIWAELSRAPQLARTYSPSLIGILLLVGYSMYVSQNLYNHFWVYAFLAIVLVSTWNIWKFFSDIHPARMGATKLVKILNHLNIKEIYTYKTNYNKSLVETIPGLGESEYTPRPKIDPPFIVHYINSIADVKTGWIVIPGTNGKSVIMDGEPEAINNNFRFTRDPVLNKLIESRDIERIATAKLKTYGTSRFWPMECEVLSYMDLILHEITAEDIYRGHAWLIHSSKLNSKF